MMAGSMLLASTSLFLVVGGGGTAGATPRTDITLPPLPSPSISPIPLPTILPSPSPTPPAPSLPPPPSPKPTTPKPTTPAPSPPDPGGGGGTPTDPGPTDPGPTDPGPTDPGPTGGGNGGPGGGNGGNQPDPGGQPGFPHNFGKLKGPLFHYGGPFHFKPPFTIGGKERQVTPPGSTSSGHTVGGGGAPVQAPAPAEPAAAPEVIRAEPASTTSQPRPFALWPLLPAGLLAIAAVAAVVFEPKPAKEEN
jgi:hypothetical protein